jgi:ABC-type transport system involved in cytochrome c biogenesis permease component
MTDQGICSKCSQTDSCKELYQQMADNKGSSVLGKVLIAFAVPLLSFVLAVAIFHVLMAGLTSKTLATALSFTLAVGTMVLVAVVTQAVNRQLEGNRQN